jgi:hypothetical protein
MIILSANNEKNIFNNIIMVKNCNCQNCINNNNNNNYIAKLYYTTRNEINGRFYDNAENINYITTDQTNIYRGSAVLRMTDSKYKPLLTTKIQFNGERIVPSNPLSNLLEPQYTEKLLLQTPCGEIEASTIYNDSGTGFETTIDFVDYYVNHATQKYKKAKRVRIIFDNDGTKSGTKFSRVVEIYKK